jgi:hypothetical protein
MVNFVNSVIFGRFLPMSNPTPSMLHIIKGLFGSGDIPKWLGVATEKVVAKRLV